MKLKCNAFNIFYRQSFKKVHSFKIKICAVIIYILNNEGFGGKFFLL